MVVRRMRRVIDEARELKMRAYLANLRTATLIRHWPRRMFWRASTCRQAGASRNHLKREASRPMLVITAILSAINYLTPVSNLRPEAQGDDVKALVALICLGNRCWR